MTKAISACLAGVKCRYDGQSSFSPKVLELIKEEGIVLICPEVCGGLSTPRTPAERQSGGRILDKNGDDVTAAFEKGARRALKIVKENGCDQVVLKSKSPSCGCGLIYDGSFSGKLKKGDGIFAELLKENGIEVLSEEQI